MSETVDITYTASNYGKAPGDRESLSPDEAKRLVHAGVAKFSNKTSAKAAGIDPDKS